jgi:hypothetical protein
VVGGKTSLMWPVVIWRASKYDINNECYVPLSPYIPPSCSPFIHCSIHTLHPAATHHHLHPVTSLARSLGVIFSVRPRLPQRRPDIARGNNVHSHPSEGLIDS